MKFAIGADHTGVGAKKILVAFLEENGHEVEDFGAFDPEVNVDYPDYGERVAEAVSSGKVSLGILICGTGIGMSIVANKFKGVRASLVMNEFMAEYSKRHNNANIIIFPGRILSPEYMKQLLSVWLRSSFDGGRHQRRIEKICAIEEKNFK